MKSLFKTACILLAVSASTAAIAAKTPVRPNVVVIVADDMGFNDLGAFGGEIRTPNLDALATSGLRLTDFHAAPTCSPTRSMLLTGTDNHTAGVGAMAETRTMAGSEDSPASWGYEGVITSRVATVAERLRAGGYFTTMAGKWHLGLAAEQDPHARGFDSSFALLQGGNNHFGGGFGPQSNPNLRATYSENGHDMTIPADFYSSDYFTTKLLSQIAARPKDKPFFGLLTFTAPHSPLQAPPEDIARYKGRYDAGWAALRDERLARMKTLGLIPNDIVPAPFDRSKEVWDKLTAEQKRVESHKMEIYAAMIDRIDQNVGRLVAQLKKSGDYKNTLFFFTSDNGPAAEGAELYGRLPGMAAYLAAQDHSYEAMGTKASSVFYGPNWAQVASAPYSLFKGVITEGGTRVAAFITYPALRRQKDFGRAFASVMDVTPTILDVAAVKADRTVGGREIAPIRGTSLLPYLEKRSDRVHAPDETISFELHGHRAVRQGDWKLSWVAKPFGPARWALYDLKSDPAEQNDLSDKDPQRTQTLIAAWEAFARETHIEERPGIGL